LRPPKSRAFGAAPFGTQLAPVSRIVDFAGRPCGYCWNREATALPLQCCHLFKHSAEKPSEESVFGNPNYSPREGAGYCSQPLFEFIRCISATVNLNVQACPGRWNCQDNYRRSTCCVAGPPWDTSPRCRYGPASQFDPSVWFQRRYRRPLQCPHQSGRVAGESGIHKLTSSTIELGRAETEFLHEPAREFFLRTCLEKTRCFASIMHRYWSR
jgi:hypothetical protein